MVVRPLRLDSPDVLQALYHCPPGELSAHKLRYERLLSLFDKTYPGKKPQIIVRAPGRVNLIGEHTDYNGYPVLPMAIDRDFVFILSSNSDRTVRLQNENPLFSTRTFQAEFPMPPYQQGDWGNYVKAAVHGILEAGLVDSTHALGFDAIVGGTIPESAGLSSSSALVVASALALLAANVVPVDRKSLADLLARAERYVGSEGGGMDQAVSLLAEAGHALKIDFFPLRTETVPLESDLTFVICNSLVRAPKSEAARYGYNCRVIECRLATGLVADALQKHRGDPVRAERLADLSAGAFGLESDAMVSIAREAIGEAPLSIRDVASRLRQSEDYVRRSFCMLRDGTVLHEPPEGFKVWNRYRHIVTEARRVNEAVEAFRRGNHAELGSLMNDSHASCRDDYEISCPELDMLVSVARSHGAVGARLTGAGFGGCTVNAVPSDKVEQFIRGVTEEYYDSYVTASKGSTFSAYANISDVIFPCRATQGAGAVNIG